jgi:hypothetical protein
MKATPPATIAGLKNLDRVFIGYLLLTYNDKNVLKPFLNLTSLSPWGNSCFSGDDSRQSVAMLTA